MRIKEEEWDQFTGRNYRKAGEEEKKRIKEGRHHTPL
jgi:hypothetical protein